MTEQHSHPVMCPNCKNEIDPDVCWCGDEIDHSPWAGHTPIPIGCTCGYDTPETEV